MSQLKPIVFGLFIALMLAASGSSAEISFDRAVQFGSAYSMADYNSDFVPSWGGVTDRIYYVPPSRVSGLGMEIRGISGSGNHLTTGETPIELLRTQRSTYTTANANVAEFGYKRGSAKDKEDESTSGAYRFDSKLHRFGQVVNQNDLRLSRGNAVSEQTSFVDASSFTASGRIGTFVQLHNELSGAYSTASSTAANTIDLAYRVNEDMDFRLIGELAEYANIDMTFSILDFSTKETLYEIVSSETTKQAFELEGTLHSGDYNFVLTAASDSGRTQNGYGPSGFGEYSLDFQATPEMRFDAVSDSAYMSRDIARAGQVLAFAVVPEPSSSATFALALAGVCVLGRRRR